MTVKMVYVSGPISHPDQWGRLQNIMAALDVARHVWKAAPGRVGVLCPHGSTYFMDGEDIPYDSFMAGDLEMVRRADAVVMMPDWRSSRGAVMEHDEAVRHGKQTFYWPIDRPALTRWLMGEDDVQRTAWGFLSPAPVEV